MKPQVSIVLYLFGILFCSGLNGQETFDSQIVKYDSEDKPDSAYLVIDKYEKIYRSNEQWDSLLYVLHQKCNLSFRYKSIDLVHQQILEAEAIAEQYVEESNLLYLNFLKFKSDVKQDIGAYGEAMDILDKIIAVGSTFANDSTGIVVGAKAEKAFLFLYLGKPKESKELGKSVYSRIMEIGDTSQMTSVLQALAVACNWLNEHDAALAYNLENLELIKKSFSEKHPNVALMQSQIADVYSDKGQNDKALAYYNKAKAINHYNYRNTGSGRFLANTIANLGDFYINVGEYRLAIDHLVYSLELQEAEYGENSWRNMWHYSSLATACRLYEDYDQADYYIQKAFDLISKNEQATEFDHQLFMGKRAEMLYVRDVNEEALPMALEVYEYFENNKDYGSTNNRLHILNLITDIYIDEGDIDNALIWANKNLDYHNKNTEPQSSLRINVLISYLDLLIDANEVEKAFQTKEEILKLRNKGNQILTLSNCIPDHELLFFSSKWVKFLMKMAQNDDEYNKKYFEFLKEFEAYYPLHLSTIKTNSNLASNERYLREIYTPSIRLSGKENAEAALLYMEKCKNFSTKQILQSQLIDDKNLPTLDYTLEDSPELTQDSIPVDLFFEMAASLDSVSNYKDSLFKADRVKYEKYFGVKELTLEDVRGVIDTDELLVNLFIDDTAIFIVYVSKESVYFDTVSNAIVTDLATTILETNDVEKGKTLRNLLLPDDKIKGFRKIKLLPDGILNSLSFEQLEYEGQPLIHSKLISYGLSVSVLLFQQKLTNKKENKNQFLGLTPGFTRDFKSKVEGLYTEADSGFNYLLQQPFLLSLSENLSRSFQGETYIELDATESVFKSKAQDFRVIHIGTHGILNDKSPLFSRLIFAKDSLEDGNLHAYELYGKNLNADLAVLSACSSGKEETFASEGIVSLSHAFTHAGCPSVLMTKWDVDEKSTSIILEQFYANLKQGMTKSESLREAKLKFLQDSPVELHDPYYWAGLVLIGDDSAIFSKSWFSSDVGLALLTLLILLILYFVLKRRSRD